MTTRPIRIADAVVTTDLVDTICFGSGPLTGTELRSMWDELIRVVGSEGISRGMLTLGGTRPAGCGRHLSEFEIHLRLREGMEVRIEHCGCRKWSAPEAPPPADAMTWAQGFSDEILWCWRSRDGLFALMAEIAEAVERELARLDPGRPRSSISVEPALYGTARMRMRRVRVGFDLLQDGMLPERHHREFDSVKSVARFFRSMAPYQKQLRKARDELAAIGARGAVDALGVEAMRQAGVDPLRVLAEAATAPGGSLVDIDGRPMFLRWRNGTLEAEIELSDGITWNFGRIRFEGNRDVGRTGPDSMIGTFVNSPLIRADALVRCTQIDDKGTTLTIRPALQHFRLIGRRAEWLEADAEAGEGRQRIPDGG